MNKKYILKSHPELVSGSQSGRSMVEMLGVLAVIGVLSVAGIAGYTTAMRSYRTNEIVNAASMLYVMAMAQNAGNGPTENVAYTGVGGTNPSGISTLQYNKDDKTITITFDDPNDCTMALNKLGDKAKGTCSAGSATLTVTLGEESEDISPSISCAECSVSVRNNGSRCINAETLEECSGCIIAGSECINSSTCNKICSTMCFDGWDEDFADCCSGSGANSEYSTCSNYF